MSSSSSEDKKSYNYEANSIADQTQLKILKLLKELTVELKTVKVAVPQQPRFGKKTLDNKKYLRKQTDQYC